ncbi:MAG: NYN domain-containing protein [bacterium]|nr:NYN domain-containing protein [bacterium]
MADEIHKCALKHSKYPGDLEEYTLYRIFYYDCMPLAKRFHNPVTNRSIDLSKSDVSKFRIELFKELKRKRKLALRLGEVKDSNEWFIRSRIVKELLKGKKQVDDIKEDDVFL